MPRLVGKKNNSALYVGLVILIAAISAVGLEYFGVIDFIPGFGKETKTNSTYLGQPSQLNKRAN